MTGPESEGLKKGTSLLSVELIPFSLFLRKFSRTFGMAESFMSGLPGCRYSNQIVMFFNASRSCFSRVSCLLGFKKINP